MSRSTNLAVGLFGSFALSLVAIVLAPQAQLASLTPVYNEEERTMYPIDYGQQPSGAEIYKREGCMYCHTQQVRDSHTGSDIDRGWGTRRTVARDYLYEAAPFLGTYRIGPDLANVGSKDWRNEDAADPRRPKVRDAAWHYRHLYAPQSLIKETNHPPYTYLFEERKITGQRSTEAINLPPKFAPKDGYEVVPKPDAEALVRYLRSLDRTFALPEASAAPAASAPGGTAAPAPAPAAK